MLGEIMDELEKDKSLRASYSDEKTYSWEIFFATVKDFASDFHERFSELRIAANEALTAHDLITTNAFPESSLGQDFEVGCDPTERVKVKLTEQQKHFLISRGPCQPKLEKFPNICKTRSVRSKIKANLLI